MVAQATQHIQSWPLLEAERGQFNYIEPSSKAQTSKWAILMVLQKASLPKMADRLQRTMNAGVKIQ